LGLVHGDSTTKALRGTSSSQKGEEAGFCGKLTPRQPSLFTIEGVPENLAHDAVRTELGDNHACAVDQSSDGVDVSKEHHRAVYSEVKLVRRETGWVFLVVVLWRGVTSRKIDVRGIDGHRHLQDGSAQTDQCEAH